MFHQNDSHMKTATLSHQDLLIPQACANRTANMFFNPAAALAAVTDKLAAVSPFLWLLVPVFVLLALTIAV